MTGVFDFTVAPGEAGRIDRVLAARFPGASRKRLAELFAARQVRIDGALARKGDHAAAGARVTLASRPPDPGALRPQPDPAAPLEVVHEDAHLLALAKPPGQPTHPLRAGERGTSANALVARYPECAAVGGDPREAGCAHRLDAGTSGLLLAARDPATWAVLRAAFRAGAVNKSYLALVDGRAAGGRSDAAIRGQPAAELPWQVERRFAAHTLLRVTARTGRMHQVRVHLADAGHPISGDARHGGAPGPPGLIGHFLHAAALAFAHPHGGAPLALACPLPPDRTAALLTLSGR